MKIAKVEAFPLILERDFASAAGLAGSPNHLVGDNPYRWSRDYPALYSTRLEGVLVRITLENGLIGWGETQAPLAPAVPAAIIQQLLAGVLQEEDFDGTRSRLEELYDRMYATMRVRGQTGGFMLDAMAGIDLALWDLAGKIVDKPVFQLISDHPKAQVPAYLSGLAGTGTDGRLAFAKPFLDQGFRLIKLYYESDWPMLLDLMDQLPVETAIDALWHLPSMEAAEELDSRRCAWLECPYMPEEAALHFELSRRIRTPIALGESYRTPAELQAVFPAASILQPDLGRCGITGTLRIAAMGKPIVPHVSIAFGPQIAAAIHVAAALDNCAQCEFNPKVLESANRFAAPAIQIKDAAYQIPSLPGLGFESIQLTF